MQVPEEDHRIRIGVDSCAAVTVFPKCVADGYPRLHAPGHAKSYRPASGKLLPDLGYVNPRNCGQAQSFDGGVRN